MDKLIFNEYSDLDREEMLQSNAESIEEGQYFEKLPEEELAEKRRQFSNKSIEIAKLEDKKKEAMDEFKAKLTPVKQEAKNLLVEIKTGHTEKSGKLFKMIDHENSQVGFYTAEGVLIDQRPATREESSQLSIMSSMKTAQ